MTTDLDKILANKDIDIISNHIEAMQTSLNMLQDDTIDYVNRCTILEEFKNKFEAILSSEIISAFASKSFGKYFIEHFNEFLSHIISQNNQNNRKI